MMKWIKEILSDGARLLQAPLSNILCTAGVTAILGAFVDYSKAQGLSLRGNPHFFMLFVGFGLILLGISVFIVLQKGRAHTELDYVKGVEIVRDSFTICVKATEIQAVRSTTKNSAIVLPANTSFVDDCVTDNRSALGAFFLQYFPESTPDFKTILREALEQKGLFPDVKGQYPAATTFILPDQFSKPAKIVITASAMRSSETGLTSNPHIICSCVEAIFRTTVDERIDTIYLPILGSGHGGVDRALALLFLLIAFLHYSKTYHHIRSVNIVVHPNDVERLNKSKELSQIVAL